MNMKETKRILILSFGKGRIEEDKACYIPTQYELDGEKYCREGKEYKTPFIAEPLINKFEPDELIVFGTVKSSWHSLYASLITDNTNDESYLDDDGYKRLVYIQKTYGNETKGESLTQIEGEIERIFAKVTGWERFSEKYYNANNPSLRIFLMEYGINETELQNNYKIIKRIEDNLHREYKYEVAFDITHSFRVLPLYNLIVLNYIKNITRFDIEIKHIYYGNVEVKDEINGVACIVDLADLVEVIDLTSAAKEFKDTGNARAMLSIVENKNEDALKNALESFDLATQLNDFAKVRESLEKLLEQIRKRNNRDRYTGLNEMMETVLGEKFFQQEGTDSLEDINDTELKFMLTKWFFSQNRLGLGLATGLEALRDINTPVFMKERNLAEEERKYRENAEKYFIDIASRINREISQENRTNLEVAICNLGSKLKDYKEIRNMFAHSLTRDDALEMDVDILADKVWEFNRELFKFKEAYNANPNELSELFAKKKTTNGIVIGSKCKIYIEYEKDKDIDVEQINNKKKYELYRLPNVVKNILRSAQNGLSKFQKAYILRMFLENNLSEDYEDVFIVLYGDSEDNVIYRTVLENMRVEKKVEILRRNTDKKDESLSVLLGFSMDMNNCKEIFEKDMDKYISKISHEQLVPINR